ncbi:MAG: DUF86 domain-containing protein [Thermoanaerobacterales bacterium]|nr:DUF86 domain-containing protein [Thermoanaerobacterales bacterium]
MVNRDKLRDKISYIEECLRDLTGLSAIPRERFISDRISYHAAVRILQTAIEAMIDAANHIVARERLGTPKSYAEAFKLLAKAGVIPRDFLPTVEKMVRFRNQAVHLYEDIDPAAVHDILRHHLTDFREFIGQIVRRYF